MHTLFTLEDRYGLTIEKGDSVVSLRIHPRKGNDAVEVSEMLNAWAEQAEKYHSSEISREDYDKWRYNYPKYDETSGYVKVPSKDLSDQWWTFSSTNGKICKPSIICFVYIELYRRCYMKSVGIVACSDAQKTEWKEQNQNLINFLKKAGNNVFVSNCIYEKMGVLSGSGRERANELMKLFSNPDVEAIYDISGGDIANEVLDELDFEQIKNSNATFWGYSDLTTVINAIYAQTGKSSVLYQIKNLVYGDYQDTQRQRFINKSELFNPSFRFIQGNSIRGVVVGGNIRCFLKLAGTKYFPDVTNKILLIESLRGKVPQMITYLSQLKSCGVFDKIKGILLGTFSEMEANSCEPDIISLVRLFAGNDIPIAQTKEIGHNNNSKAIWIGKEIEINK